MADDIIKDAVERFEESQEGSAHIRADGRDDIEFGRLAKQWPDQIKKQRELEGRPCLTINRLPSFIRQVVNDARQNNPSIKVTPAEDGDVDTAEVIGGLIKSIERRSNAPVAYDTALENAVSNGFGFFRVTTDYVDQYSFDQEAKIERISNPFSVHWDTNSTAFDASDWEYGFVSDFLTKDEFARKYPKAAPVSFDAGSDEGMADWVDGEKIRVAEYWLREASEKKLLLMSDGSVMREDEIPSDVKEFLSAQGIVPVQDRMATVYTVKQRIITAQEILDEKDWPGTMIPICPVWGEEIVFDGRRHFRSLIRDARDPQAMFNFWRSSSTEMVALAPRAPWLVEEGGIPRGHEEAWRTANTRSHAYLVYTRGGAAPQRQPFPSVPAGAIQEALNAADDMKAIMGIYDASLGARSNETSGKAILARQREGDVSTFHFIDNLSRAIAYCGRVLVEIMPSIYSQRQAIQILGEDDAPKMIKLGEANADGKIYNLDVGRYDVSVKTGPSFTTQREEATQAITEIMRAVPSAAPVLGDMLLRNMDWPGADVVSKRLKMLLPKPIQEAEAEETMAGLPDEAKGLVAQAKMQIEQLQGQLQQMQQEAAPEMQKNKLEAAKAAASGEIEQQRLAFEVQKHQDQMQLETAKSVNETRKLNLEEQRLALEAQQVAQQAELDRATFAAGQRDKQMAMAHEMSEGEGEEAAQSLQDNR